MMEKLRPSPGSKENQGISVGEDLVTLDHVWWTKCPVSALQFEIIVQQQSTCDCFDHVLAPMEVVSKTIVIMAKVPMLSNRAIHTDAKNRPGQAYLPRPKCKLDALLCANNADAPC